MNIKILLVDGQELFLRGIATLLTQETGFTVTGELESICDVLRVAASVEPDIVLMDIWPSGIAGLDTVGNIKRDQPQCRVVLLTAVRSETYVRAALRAGVDGYILKDVTFEELAIALRTVVKGKRYLSPDVSGHVVDNFLHPEYANGSQHQIDMLTERERDVLQLIAEGRTNRSAGEFLCVSAKTVEKHRSSLMQKLGVRNVTELTMAAMVLGLIKQPPSISRLMCDFCSSCEVIGCDTPILPIATSLFQFTVGGIG